MNHQVQCSRKRKSGKHLSYSERQIIEWEVKLNERRPKRKRLTQKVIAQKLGISASTLSRELKRGTVQLRDTHWCYYTSYSSDKAQQLYDYRASNKGPALKIGRDRVLLEQIERMLLGIDASGEQTMPYSPDAIVMELDNIGWPTETRICTRTIYHYIEADLFLGVTQKDLPRGSYRGKRGKRRVRRSHKVLSGRSIEDRPIAAEERSEYGHWEMDCIESVRGDRSCILTMVERKSREALLFKLSSQTQTAVDRALNGLERKLGGERFRQTFKSITVDNGAEFWDWELLEQSVVSRKRRTTLYYAHPYSSWERGSNENMNGFVRYSIPKGTRIGDWTRQKIQQLNRDINHYPIRILKGQSAVMVSPQAIMA